MTIYHIGYHKTGTTWINNVLLPQVRPVLNQRGIRVVCKEGLSGSLLHDDTGRAAQLAAEAPDSKVVICVRNQKTMIGSLYWLYVKSGGCLSLPRYVDALIANGKLRYDVLAGAYVDAFGEDRVLVLTYERLRTDPHDWLAVVAAFWRIPAETMPSALAEQRVNPRPTDGFVELTRLANTALRPRARPAFLARRVPQLLWLALEKPVIAAGRRHGIHRRDDNGVMMAIDAAYAVSNRALAGRFAVDLAGCGYPGVP
ncbi:MAG: sulfotransferase domain-containing protein [Rhodospirillales bacterium]|nr:sulfotransferase domain-containing protein [Rhodospirillales bacterium]